MNIVGRHRPPCLTSGSQGSISQHGNRLQVPGLRHNYVGVEHLLLGLSADGVAGPLVSAAGASRDAILEQIRRIVGEGEGTPGGTIPFTPRSKRALEVAARAAGRSGQHVRPTHILLGILDLREGVGAEVLDTLVARDDLRRAAKEALPEGARLVERLAGFANRHWILAMFAGAVPMVIVETALGPDVDTGGWERLAYLFPLLYRFLIASDRRFQASLRRARWSALAGARVASAALVVWVAALGQSGQDVWDGSVPGLGALQGLAGWLWVVSILGFAGSLMARRRSHSEISADSARRAPNRGPPGLPGTRTRPCCPSTCCTSP
jgi:Clp amino terminal domain, pathogenicity island component